MIERDERLVALLAEICILEGVWNAQVNAWLNDPNLPAEGDGGIGWVVTTSELAETFGMGESTVRRTCDRLAESGRLRRWRSGSGMPYAYQVRREAIAALACELMLRCTVYIHEYKGGWIHIELRDCS